MSIKGTTRGILIPMKNRGKENKLIPWDMIKKETIVKSVRHCTNKHHGIDAYLVDKRIDGERMMELFETKREAFKALDMFLIRKGREPELILKRL